jgi:hypothetical protein
MIELKRGERETAAVEKALSNLAPIAMFRAWQVEDYLLALEQAPEAVDFWEPRSSSLQSATAAPPQLPNDFWDTSQPRQQSAPTGLQHPACAFDFWDPVPASEGGAVEPVSDWSEDIALPLYEAYASENPFRLEERPRSREGIIQRRARWLASLLDLPTMRARRRFAERFEDLFDEFPHHNTFRVLSELAIDGASADEILASFELRQVWADHPIFWSIRRKGHRGLFIPDRGERQLGWTRAVRLANLAKGLPAQRIIDFDWYEEWLQLPYGGPLFWSVLEYASARLESFSKGVLAVPERLEQLEEGTQIQYQTYPISIDGLKVGSHARTGLLVRLETESLSFVCRKVVQPKKRGYQDEAAE